MALFKPYHITSSQLASLPIVNGQFIIASDTGQMWIDKDSKRVEIPLHDNIDLSSYVTESELTTAIAQETSARQNQDSILQGKIETKLDGNDLIPGDNVTIDYDETSGQVTLSAIDTNTNTTYFLSKSGSEIVLTGSDGKTTKVIDSDTTYSAATQSATGLMSAADKTKLDGIATGANKYSLPVATSSALGGVKVGFPESGKNYPVELNTSNQMYVNVPWTDTNTTYTLSSFGITATADELNYTDGVTSNIQTQLNGKAASSHTHANVTTSAAGFMTAADKTKLDGIATGANKTVVDSALSSTSTNPVQNKIVNSALAGKAASSHSHSVATTTAAGYLPTLGGGTTNYLRADGTWAKPPDTNTTYSNMKGATASAAGTAGLVPAPAAGAAIRYLRSDGTWQVPPDTNTTYTLSSFGITATAAELNHLDGITATVTELNYTDGVTSNIQTQLNGKLSTSGTAAAAAKLATARTFSLTGNVTGSASFNGTENCSIAATIANNSVTMAKLGSDVGTIAVQSAAPTDSHVKLWIKV